MSRLQKHVCTKSAVLNELSEDTFEKENGTALKKTCDHGNSFCQFDLEMTLT